VNLLFAFGRGRWVLAGAALSGTVLLLPLAYVIRTRPVTYQGAAAALRLPDPSAAPAGATGSPSTVVLLWPMLTPPLSLVTSSASSSRASSLRPAAPISVIDQLYRPTIAVPPPTHQ
jgi:hypothetical protein